MRQADQGCNIKQGLKAGVTLLFCFTLHHTARQVKVAHEVSAYTLIIQTIKKRNLCFQCITWIYRILKHVVNKSRTISTTEKCVFGNTSCDAASITIINHKLGTKDLLAAPFFYCVMCCEKQVLCPLLSK